MQLEQCNTACKVAASELGLGHMNMQTNCESQDNIVLVSGSIQAKSLSMICSMWKMLVENNYFGKLRLGNILPPLLLESKYLVFVLKACVCLSIALQVYDWNCVSLYVRCFCAMTQVLTGFTFYGG